MRRKLAPARTKVKRSRTRSGCFTCRDRHMKCDEQLPVCQNCLTSKRKCIRGVRLNFTLYTFYDPKESMPDPSEAGPESLAPMDLYTALRYFGFLDQSVAVSTLYENGKKAYRPYLHLHSEQDLAEAARQISVDCNSSKAVSTLDTNYIPPMLHTTLPQIAVPARVDDPFQNQYHQDRSSLLSLRPHETVQQPYVNPGHNLLNLSHNPPDAFLLSELNPSEPRENVILENYDITNLLTNPELQGREFPMDYPLTHASLPQPDHRRSSVEILNELPTDSSVDADLFIDLIQRFRYHWLLDLFNEIHWWRVLVPNYCVRLAQAAEVEGKRPPGSAFLLIDCLMACADTSSLDEILEASQSQFTEWAFFEDKEVNVSTFRSFERVLLSVALVTLSLLIQITSKPTLIYDEKFQLLLLNQGKLFHKIMVQFTQVPQGRLKKLKQSPLTLESIQAMTVLRFMIKMNLQARNPSFTYSINASNSESVLAEVIDYSLPQHIDLSHFFTISDFEIQLLNDSFANFDLPQMSSQNPRVPASSISESRKLRVLLWEVIKTDYATDNPDIVNRFTSHQEAFQFLKSTDISIGRRLRYPHVSTNERSIALNFLSLHLNKIHRYTPQDTRAGCVKLFQMIDESSMDKSFVAQWHRYFSWVLE